MLLAGPLILSSALEFFGQWKPMQTLWANQKAKGFSEIQVAICQTFKWKWKMNETKDFFAKVRHWFLSCLISEYHLSSVFFFRLLNVNFNEAFQSFRHDGGRPYSCWAATIKMSSTTKLCGFFNWRRTVCYTRTIRIKGYFKLHFPFLKGFKAFFCAEVTIFPRFFMRFLQPCLKICQREESIMIQRTSMTTKGGVAFMFLTGCSLTLE